VLLFYFAFNLNEHQFEQSIVGPLHNYIFIVVVVVVVVVAIIICDSGVKVLR